MKMSNRHLFLSTLHTNICSLYTKKFLKKFCKNTWLFPAPCGIIKGWGVGGTGVPYIFFWSEPSLLLYHILKQKSIKIEKIFLKNFSKKTWLSGAKCDIIKGGEVFFFFFFFWRSAGYACSSQLQLRYARRRCRAGPAGTLPPPDLIPTRTEQMFEYWLYLIFCYNYVRGGKDALIYKILFDTLGCVVFHYYIYKQVKTFLKKL